MSIENGNRTFRSRFDAGLRALAYRPIEIIGKGGMAEVWRSDAVFEDGSEPVAIKRIRDGLETEVFALMFEDEARLGRFLVHPNLVRMVDVTHVDGARSMVMEHVDGDSLKVIAERARS